jgi:hypothetical protein
MELGFTALLQDYERKKKELLDAITQTIESLPDNPHTKQLGAGCFTMSSSQLLNASWSVEYYDFKYQYRQISEALRIAVNPEVKLKTIITEGKMLVYSHGKPRTLNLHPEVISNLINLK